MESFAVIIPAGGESRRFGAGSNKLLQMLHGRAVIAWAVEAFLRRGDVGQVVVATRDEAIKGALPGDPRIEFVGGGASRGQSVWAGVKAVDAKTNWVAIHDAARPLVSQELIERTLREARLRGAAAAAMPVQLTIKQATGPLPAKVERTVPRRMLWAMQTPQVMRREALLEAFERCPLPLGEVTDDAQLLELVGQEVWLVEGEERNVKITTQADLALAELLLKDGGRAP